MSSSQSVNESAVERVSRETLLARAPDSELLKRYATLLRDEGPRRGLIGPRELDRLWSRHLLNCAIPALEPEVVPTGATVMDVGSGAGLPGIVWAILRPDLSVIPVDSQKRRSEFLVEAVESLDLGDRVRVFRERVEDLPAGMSADVVTARAVGPLTRIIPWLAPRVRSGGRIVALKGRSLPQELLDAEDLFDHFGLQGTQVLELGEEYPEGATVLVAHRR